MGSRPQLQLMDYGCVFTTWVVSLSLYPLIICLLLKYGPLSRYYYARMDLSVIHKWYLLLDWALLKLYDFCFCVEVSTWYSASLVLCICTSVWIMTTLLLDLQFETLWIPAVSTHTLVDASFDCMSVDMTRLSSNSYFIRFKDGEPLHVLQAGNYASDCITWCPESDEW